MHPGHQQEERPAAVSPSPPSRRTAARPRHRRRMGRRRVIRRLRGRRRLALEVGRRDRDDRAALRRPRPDHHLVAVSVAYEGPPVRVPILVGEEAPVQVDRTPRPRPHVPVERAAAYVHRAVVQDRHAQPPAVLVVPAAASHPAPAAGERPPPYLGLGPESVDDERVAAHAVARVSPLHRRSVVELAPGAGARSALAVVEVDAVPAVRVVVDAVGGGEADAAARDGPPPAHEGGRDREPFRVGDHRWRIRSCFLAHQD